MNFIAKEIRKNLSTVLKNQSAIMVMNGNKIPERRQAICPIFYRQISLQKPLVEKTL